MDKKRIENDILNYAKTSTEESQDFNGYFGKKYMIRAITFFTFKSIGWNEEHNRPATKFTSKEVYGIRYLVNDKYLKENEVEKISEVILNKMIEKGFIISSKSGKCVKYIGY